MENFLNYLITTNYSIHHIKKGLPDKEYINLKINEENIYDINDYVIEDVISEGNCGYRALSLQLYKTEDKYDSIRKNVYNYLNNNRNQYAHLSFQYNGELISANEYIDKIKNNNEWMGDLEISICSIIYNFYLLLFGISFNDNLSLINKYGDIKDNKILLTLCYVNQSHFKVLYEKTDNK